jgi:hypothetical protein
VTKERLTALRRKQIWSLGVHLSYMSLAIFYVIRSHLSVISEFSPIANVLVSKVTEHTQSVCSTFFIKYLWLNLELKALMRAGNVLLSHLESHLILQNESL